MMVNVDVLIWMGWLSLVMSMQGNINGYVNNGSVAYDSDVMALTMYLVMMNLSGMAYTYGQIFDPNITEIFRIIVTYLVLHMLAGSKIVDNCNCSSNSRHVGHDHVESEYPGGRIIGIRSEGDPVR